MNIAKQLIEWREALWRFAQNTISPAGAQTRTARSENNELT